MLGMALAMEALDRDSEAEKLYSEAIRAGEKQAAADFERFQRKRSSPGVPSPEILFDPRDLPVTVRNGATGDKRLIETMIAGVAVLDYDGDGWPDIYICNGNGEANALLRNNHDGSFTDVASLAGVTARGYSMGVASADFDNDGHPDLFVTGVHTNHLFRNRGDGTFQELPFPQDGKWAVAAAWLDYDNDGLLGSLRSSLRGVGRVARALLRNPGVQAGIAIRKSTNRSRTLFTVISVAAGFATFRWRAA